MRQNDFGKRIAKLRKEAGYTQQMLADALMITDKAISKWERGICLPDSSMLPKIAGLLNTDLGTLLPDPHLPEDWKGILILKQNEIGTNRLINGQPVIDYLLSYFLLLGITNVGIKNDTSFAIDRELFAHYGIKITDDVTPTEKTMIVFGQTILFGAYLTQQLKNMMAMEENVQPVIDGIPVPIIFVHHEEHDFLSTLENTKKRSLYRGIVNLPLNNEDDCLDAEMFIRIYEKHHRIKYCNLAEISKNRGIIV